VRISCLPLTLHQSAARVRAIRSSIKRWPVNELRLDELTGPAFLEIARGGGNQGGAFRKIHEAWRGARVARLRNATRGAIEAHELFPLHEFLGIDAHGAPKSTAGSRGARIPSRARR